MDNEERVQANDTTTLGFIETKRGPKIDRSVGELMQYWPTCT